MGVRFNEGVVVEVVGNEILILDSDHHAVHTFPLSYLDTVHALSQGKNVRNRDQLTELENLGLVTSGSRGLPRRAVLVGAGALGAALAMPTAAVASSEALNETFFVGNDVFNWFAQSDDTLIVAGFGLEPASEFQAGDPWLLTIGGETATATFDAIGGQELVFEGINLIPTPGEELSGRLSGSNGALSNLFRISEGSSG